MVALKRNSTCGKLKNGCGKITKKIKKSYNIENEMIMAKVCLSQFSHNQKEKNSMFCSFRYGGKRNRCCGTMEINLEQLEKMVEQGAILVDVRSPQEFEEGHLENAILLPEYEIKNEVKHILPDPIQTIVVYCSTGHRGIKAQRILQRLGYKHVYNLCHGLENYN